MLELKSTLELKYRWQRSSTRRTENTLNYSIVDANNNPVDGMIAGMWSGFNNRSVGYCGFFVACKTKPATAALADMYKIWRDGVATGIDNPSDAGEMHNSGGTISNFITSDYESQGFTAGYNTVYDDTLTPAQCFAKLQQIYGEDYVYFGYTGLLNSYTCPQIYGNYQWEFSNDPENTSIDAIATNSWSPTVILSTFEDSFLGGLVAVEEEYLPRIGTDNFYKLLVYFIFSPSPLPPEKLIFDVYLDGQIGGKGVSIQIKWRNNNPDTSVLAPSLIKPQLWGAGYPGIVEPSGRPSSFLKTVDGIVVPDTDKTPFIRLYNFDDEGYTATYVGESETWYNNYSNVERVLNFGIDMIPITLVYLLRFNYILDGMKWGDLWYVYIPYNYEGAVYVEHAEIDNSANEPQFQTEVNIIGGIPSDDTPDDPDETEPGVDDNDDPSPVGPYDPDAPKIDFTESTPEGFGGNSVLTKTYCMNTLTMMNVGGKLWSQSYFDVLKVQANPIENIISCKWFPFTVSGTTEEIQIGNVPFGVQAQSIANIKVIPFTTGYKYTTNSNRPGYLSCSPYTMLKLHLPYCGVVQLDATELLDRTLNGKYVIDLTTGDVLVILTLDGMPYMNIAGKMGVDIPLSATNRAQTELSIASKALSATIGAAAQIMGGNPLGGAAEAGNGIMSVMGMDYTTQRSGTHSPACSTYEDRSVWLEIQRSIAYVSEGYKRGHGFPAHLYRKLARGQGYVKCDKRVEINVAMTDEENRMLEQIMVNGFYV